MLKEIPPHLILLAVISRSASGLTLNEIALHLHQLNIRGVKTGYYIMRGRYCGYEIPRELLLDIATLKSLGLVEEVGGRYVVSERGFALLESVKEKSSVIRAITGAGPANLGAPQRSAD